MSSSSAASIKQQKAVSKKNARAPCARKKCSHEGCTKLARAGGVCVRHGSKLKQCSSEGCTHIVVKGGVRVRHGAKAKYSRCKSVDGCTNFAINGGVYVSNTGQNMRGRNAAKEGVQNMLKTLECASGMERKNKHKPNVEETSKVKGNIRAQIMMSLLHLDPSSR